MLVVIQMSLTYSTYLWMNRNTIKPKVRGPVYVYFALFLAQFAVLDV
jgi:hypothetical protein